eukprot:TRINITY_DN6937_c0_g1_i1.p1 TRINITY_DN6937_c0_g1~~TRINITY_DN6937_c0_g1_i1.p1  ORF type:complete len:150 (-),score=31.41 TRINITY_DN6937_c0_g1_i1:179-628(-)
MVSVIWLSFICVALNHVDGSVLDLGAMVATSGACFAAKLWKNYGCFCGLGQCGSGVPVDCLDSCCAAHDRCYSASRYHQEISNEETIFMKYSWRRTKGKRIICHDCKKGGDRKKCRKCNCDKQLTLCLRGKPCPALFGGNRAAQCPATP